METLKKVFILHGWTYTTEKWNELNRRLTVGGLTPVVLTVPGLTESTDKVWTLDDYVYWLKERLVQEQKPILIAHSNGGRIALALAAQNPERLGKLILIDSAGIYHNEWPIRFKRLVFGAAAKIGKKITASAVLKNLLYTLAGARDYKNATPQMRQTMTNLISVDLTPLLSAITTPTLIIWGKRDRSTPLKDGETMHAKIKNSKLYVIENAGHSPHATHPEEVAKKILEAIK